MIPKRVNTNTQRLSIDWPRDKTIRNRNSFQLIGFPTNSL